MVRFLIFLVGMLTTNRPGGARTVPMWQDDSRGRAESAELRAEGPDEGGAWFPRRSRHRHRRSGRTARLAGRRFSGTA